MVLITNHSCYQLVTNHCCSSVEEKDTLLSTQDKEILSILEELEETANVSAINKTMLPDYFCSDTVFNLSKRVLTKIEKKFWKKVLTKLLSKKKINEPEVKQDFEKFCHKMRRKWHFRNEPSPEFGSTSAFNPKSKLKAPNGSPSLELF